MGVFFFFFFFKYNITKCSQLNVKCHKLSDQCQCHWHSER